MDIHERTSQIISIFHQLREMNLEIMGYEEFDQFKTICNSFIKNGVPINVDTFHCSELNELYSIDSMIRK